jgi:pimeloyl-ACP methyl ester carboxylesterase
MQAGVQMGETNASIDGKSLSREGLTHKEGDATNLRQRTGASMETITSTVTSQDGTTIAYDKLGHGPAVILVAGAFCSRSFWSGPQLAKLLASRFTVYNYDRRGRGESGDTKPYAVAREIEDIDALIAAAGGPAFVYGHSSGAALAMEAAVELGDKVKKLAMYEAPYNDDAQAKLAWREYIKQLTELLAADRRGDAAALFMKSTGMPDEQIEGMRHAPVWPMFEALAPTLAYDHTAILGEDARVPTERAALVTAPTLILHGGASYSFMADTAQALGKAIPHAQVRTLEGQGHNVASEALAPVLEEFFTQ